jgi:TRAP-type C4-dicarboxylate transport system permease small subunit
MEQRHSIFASVQKIISAVIGIIMMLIMIIVFVQTFTRYVIFYSIPWSEEASRYLFVALILLGTNLAITQNQMVSIDLIDSFLSEGTKKKLEVIRQFLSLAISATFFYSSFGMLEIGGFQMSPAMRLPMNIMYGIVSLGFGLMVIAVILQMLDRCFTQNPQGGKVK